MLGWMPSVEKCCPFIRLRIAVAAVGSIRLLILALFFIVFLHTLVEHEKQKAEGEEGQRDEAAHQIAMGVVGGMMDGVALVMLVFILVIVSFLMMIELLLILSAILKIKWPLLIWVAEANVATIILVVVIMLQLGIAPDEDLEDEDVSNGENNDNEGKKSENNEASPVGIDFATITVLLVNVYCTWLVLSFLKSLYKSEGRIVRVPPTTDATLSTTLFMPSPSRPHEHQELNEQQQHYLPSAPPTA